MKGKKYFQWLAVMNVNNGHQHKEWKIILDRMLACGLPKWVMDAYYDAASNHYYNVILPQQGKE